MGLIARLVAHAARRRLARMRALALDPAPAQEARFQRLLAAGRRTAFGRLYGFERVRTYADWRSAVPLGDYRAFEPWWKRARVGEASVTWPGRIRYFGLSSGTTSGEKYLPLSDATLRTNRGGAFDNLAPYLAQHADRFLGGRLVFLSASTSLTREGAVAVGDNTGVMAARIPWPFRRLASPGPTVRALKDGAERLTRTAEESLGQDVRMLAGLPSWITVFAQDVLSAAAAGGRRARTLRDLWPRLGVIVHGGAGFLPYQERLRALVGPDVWTLEGYSATEGGMLAVQDDPRDPTLVPLVDRGVFFEFVPVEEVDATRPRRLRLHEVEPGVDYAVALTTNSGMWAYLVGDVVSFVASERRRLVFRGRIAHTLNAFGEHVSGGELEQAVLEAGLAVGARVREYAVAAHVPDDVCPTGRHVWYVELDDSSVDVERMAQVIDRRLQSGNADYAAHRIRRFGMDGPLVRPVPSGAFLAWMRRRRKVGGQAKIPRVLTSAQERELGVVADRLALLGVPD
jgi:hypothetical protein